MCIWVDVLENMFTPVLLLIISFGDTFGTIVYFWDIYMWLLGNFLDLAEPRLILADFGWVCLASMTLLPEIAACSTEAG